jgi:electron transport complex protein RnfG
MEPIVENGLTNNGLGRSNLAQAWLVLLLALLFGTALAAVQINLADIIAANKRNETLSKVPDLVLGIEKATQVKGQNLPLEIAAGLVTVPKTIKTVVYPIYRVTLNGQLEGWVVKAAGQGYADKIELLVGLDPRAETIAGLFILEQKETPGLGNNISTAGWRNQFIHKKTAQPLEVKKNSQQGGDPNSAIIDAITGATISSRAVTTIVNSAVADVKERLTAEHIQWAERK